MSQTPAIKADVVETGSGQTVMLVHSSASGARQWHRLMDDLKDQFHVQAVNLFGYGNTAAWPGELAQTLEDQAQLVEAALPTSAESVCLVGHSFGGLVAMKVAARLAGRVSKLVLLEPIPFSLLKHAGSSEAFAEVMALRDLVKQFGAVGEWSKAAEAFADYWGGAGTWSSLSPQKRDAFAGALRPNYFEWDAVMDETRVEEWVRRLPSATLLVSDSATVRPVREITNLLRESCPTWTFREIAAGGHMTPVTRPDLINPLVAKFLDAPIRCHQDGLALTTE